MFAEWSDPYDIDQYYNEVGSVYSRVNAYSNKANDNQRAIEVNTNESSSKEQLNLLPDNQPIKIPIAYNEPPSNEIQKKVALRTDTLIEPNQRDAFLPYYKNGNSRVLTVDIDITYLLILIVVIMMFIHILKLYASLETTKTAIYELSLNVQMLLQKNRQS